MSTKQIKIEYQVQNLAGNLDNVTIQLGTTTLFAGSLEETGSVFQSNPPSGSTGEITFDYDIVDWALNSDLLVTTPISITVSGGTFMIDTVSANYTLHNVNVGTAETPVWQLQAGTVDSFVVLDIQSQPLWNDVADLSRYNYALSQENNMGPGQVLVRNGETATFDLGVTKFNNQYPLPPV
jgi:hypothetical protein